MILKTLKLSSIIIILTSLLLLSGCSGGGSVDDATAHNFKQGVGNLAVRLLPNAPPDKIYPESKFKIVVEVDNQMAYDAHNGQVSIWGLEDNYFLLDTEQMAFDTLVGKGLLTPLGDKSYLEFPAISGKIFQNAEEYINPFYLMTEFDSEIEFSDTLCINPDLYAVYNSGCKVDEQKSYPGQGGVLAITKLEEIIYPDDRGGEVEFRLLLQNRGKGKIKGEVRLLSSELGGKNINCRFHSGVGIEESVTFKEDKQDAILTCKDFIKGSNSYTTTLYLKLAYHYEQEDLRQLRLINPGKITSSGFSFS
jgi:hypothetical protein